MRIMSLPKSTFRSIGYRTWDLSESCQIVCGVVDHPHKAQWWVTIYINNINHMAIDITRDTARLILRVLNYSNNHIE